MNLSDLCKETYDNAVSKGFYEKPEPEPVPTRLALVHSEVSEALEAYRERGMEDWYREDGKPDGIASELADVVIRIADMAAALGIDLEGKVKEKMKYNAGRPHKHGKAF